MKRRNFLFISLLALPFSSFSKFKNFIRSKRGIKVSAAETRLNGETKPEEANFIRCIVSGKDTEDEISVFTGGANGGPPLHVHLYQDEIFYIIEGEFLFQVGDEKFDLKAGDTIFAPRQVPHTFLNKGGKPGNMVNTFQPAGKMEGFFSKLNAYIKLNKSIPKPADFKELFEQHDMKIAGPGLTLN